MRRARSATGWPSVSGRTSSKARSTRTLVAIWKSAALGSSSPITPAAVGVGGEEGRLGHELVEQPRDLPRALDAAAVDAQGRHGDPAESHHPYDQRLEAGQDVHHLVLDALALEHQPGGL